MAEARPVAQQVDDAVLVALLRQGDASWPAQVALDLLAEHEVWLHAPEFRAQVRPHSGSATIDWAAFAASVPGFPWEHHTPSETTVARIACSLADAAVLIGVQEFALLAPGDHDLVARALRRVRLPGADLQQ